MKTRRAQYSGREGIVQASLLGMVVLVAMALASILVSGCTTETAPPFALSGTSPEPVTAATVSHADLSRALHERVMAEQGRGAGTVAAADRTTGASAGPPQSATTTSEITAAQQSMTTTVVLTDGQTPLRGVWGGTADQLASYLLRVSPTPRFTVSATVLAEYYVRYGAEADLRADLLWAQMLHETAHGMYGGDVLPEQNNYAGIGATGGGAPGFAFPSAETGVIAHVAHMVAYVYASTPVAWANSNTDPRYDAVSPQGGASVLSDLNGRWAVPGTSYGQNIEEIVRAINAG
jgi:hypothetical protein